MTATDRPTEPPAECVAVDRDERCLCPGGPASHRPSPPAPAAAPNERGLPGVWETWQRPGAHPSVASEYAAMEAGWTAALAAAHAETERLQAEAFEAEEEWFDAWLAAHDRQVRAQALRDAATFIDRERQSDLTDMVRITGLHDYWQNVAVGKERCVIVLRDRADAEERSE